MLHTYHTNPYIILSTTILSDRCIGNRHFFLYREVVLSLEVEIEKGGTSVCVLHRKAFFYCVLYWRFTVVIYTIHLVHTYH